MPLSDLNPLLLDRLEPAGAYPLVVSSSTARCMSSALGLVYNRVVSKLECPISSATVTMVRHL
jgi:hypothetical protein